ncbi:unnamed protein product, partial [Fusarium graminearum]
CWKSLIWAKRWDLDKDNCTTGETPLEAEDGIDALALNNTLGVTQQKTTLWESAFRRASPFMHARPGIRLLTDLGLPRPEPLIS